MADVSAMIGLKVRIKMAAPLTDEHEGDLFAYDDKNGTVAIQRLEANNNITYIVLKASGIASVECLSSSPNPDMVNPRLPPIDFNRGRRKMAKQLESEAKKLAKIGVNVSERAQQIFDGLSFTLPCTWAGQCIRLNDLDLELRPPYGANDFGSLIGEENPRGLDYVQKVLAKVKEANGIRD